MPSVVLYQGVLAVSPAKAEPLLPAAEVVGVENLGQAVRAGIGEDWRAPPGSMRGDAR